MKINISTNNKQFYFSNNFITYNTTHKVVKKENGKIVLRPIKNDGGDIPVEDLEWILATGVWNDAGAWKDDNFIEDYDVTRNIMDLSSSTKMSLVNSALIDSFEIELDFLHTTTMGNRDLIIKGAKTNTISSEQFHLRIANNNLGGTVFGTNVNFGATVDILKNGDWNHILLSVYKKDATKADIKVIVNGITTYNTELTTVGYIDNTKNYELFSDVTTLPGLNTKVAYFTFKDLKNNKTYNFDLTNSTTDRITSIEDNNFYLLKNAGTFIFNNENNYFFGIETFKPDSENINYIQPATRYLYTPFLTSANYTALEVPQANFNPNRKFSYEFDMLINNKDQIPAGIYANIFGNSNNILNSTGFYREFTMYLDNTNIYFAISSSNYSSFFINYINNIYFGEYNNFKVEVEYLTSLTYSISVYINGILVNTREASKLAITKQFYNYKISGIHNGTITTGLPYKIANLKVYDYDKYIEKDNYRIDENSDYFYTDKSYKKRINITNKVGTKTLQSLPNPFIPKVSKEVVSIEPQYRNCLKFTNNSTQRATLHKNFFNTDNDFKITGMFFLKTGAKANQTVLRDTVNYLYVNRSSNSLIVYYKGKSTTVTATLADNAWHTFSIQINKLTSTTSTLSVIINGILNTYTITHTDSTTLKIGNLLLGNPQTTNYAFEDKLMNFIFQDLTLGTTLTFRLDEDDNVSSYKCPENINALIFKNYTASIVITTENILNPLFI